MEKEIVTKYEVCQYDDLQSKDGKYMSAYDSYEGKSHFSKIFNTQKEAEEYIKKHCYIGVRKWELQGYYEHDIVTLFVLNGKYDEYGEWIEHDSMSLEILGKDYED